jgi:hypothetical protein
MSTPFRPFSKKTDDDKDMGQYVSEDEGDDKFDSDRRFSNYILFAGGLSLFLIFMASNVMKTTKSAKKE